MQSTAVNKTPTSLSDAEIVERVSAGDHGAFEQLMRRYNRVLYRTARSIVKNDAEAEDILQDAYLRVYAALKTFRGDSSLSTWLTRIVINEALGSLRKAARRAEIIDIGSTPQWANDAAEAHMNDAQFEQPEQAALRAEARKLIEAKVDGLPAAFRTVFVLRALEEMTVEETAACLVIPQATVRTRYFRAKGLLREALSSELDFALDDAFAFDGERCDRIVAGSLAHLTRLRHGPAASCERDEAAGT